MNEIGAVLGLLLMMAVLLGLAQKLKIAYPIFLVIGGLIIGLVAWSLHVKTIELEPELVFLLFLPPIIQYAAFFTPIRDFKRNARPITLLAVGLVIFTTVLVGVIAHFALDLPWAVAFVLGAIIAPPDAIAATSVTSNLKVPRRIVTVLEGESLVNDATALTALSVALAAVTTNSFSPVDAATRFFITAVGA
jgi:CPA1 family monovalent cation:H+ antiporter